MPREQRNNILNPQAEKYTAKIFHKQEVKLNHETNDNTTANHCIAILTCNVRGVPGRETGKNSALRRRLANKLLAIAGKSSREAQSRRRSSGAGGARSNSRYTQQRARGIGHRHRHSCQRVRRNWNWNCENGRRSSTAMATAGGV